MYTRCTDCKTVFHITAAELRAADGTVICGACGSTFDALETLSETRPADPGPVAETAMPGTAEPDPAEFVRDEDEFLEELESLIGAEAPDEAPDEALDLRDRYGSHHIDDDGEGLPERTLEDELDIDDALEPRLGDAQDVELDELDELDQLDQLDQLDELDELDERDDQPIDEPDGDTDGTPDEFSEYADILGDEPDESMDDAIPDPDSVFRVDDLPGDFAAGERDPFVGAEEEPEIVAETDEPRAVPVAPETDAEADHAPDDEEPLPGFDAEPPQGRAWPKVLVLLLVLLALAGTWVHTQRGKLLRHPTGQALLEPVYQRLGMPATADWDLAAYRAIQWEAVADAERPDDLAVAVDFQNTAPFAQPFPIIRVMLDDRFGRRLGMHDIPPAEYQRDHASSARMPPGGRVRTTVVVPDPSGRATSFRVDFCLEHAGRGLICGPQPFR